MTPSPAQVHRTLRHDCTFYDTEQQYLSVVGDFVRAGIDNDQPVLVAVPDERARVLQESLDGRARKVQFVDMALEGRNPGRIIPRIQGFLDHHTGRRPRFVGEPLWHGRNAQEIAEATRHESLINLAFAGAGVDVLCPYDAVGLSPTVLADARRTHPTVSGPTGSTTSPGYVEPEELCAPEHWPLSSPPASAVVEEGHSDLRVIRRLVRRHARAAGLPAARIEDAAVVFVELCTNTLRHAGGAPTMRFWREGDALLGEVADSGVIADLLVGRRRAPLEAESGRGLFLVNQLCDLVQLRSSTDGTRARVTFAANSDKVRHSA